MTIGICGPLRLGNYEIPGYRPALHNPEEIQGGWMVPAEKSLEAQQETRPGPTQPAIDSLPFEGSGPWIQQMFMELV